MTAQAIEMRRYVAEAVSLHAGLTRAEAAALAARELGLTARRVRGILAVTVNRVWADELAAARVWHHQRLDRAAARLEHQAAMARLAARECDREWLDGQG